MRECMHGDFDLGRRRRNLYARAGSGWKVPEEARRRHPAVSVANRLGYSTVQYSTRLPGCQADNSTLYVHRLTPGNEDNDEGTCRLPCCHHPHPQPHLTRRDDKPCPLNPPVPNLIVPGSSDPGHLGVPLTATGVTEVTWAQLPWLVDTADAGA